MNCDNRTEHRAFNNKSEHQCVLNMCQFFAHFDECFIVFNKHIQKVSWYPESVCSSCSCPMTLCNIMLGFWIWRIRHIISTWMLVYLCRIPSAVVFNCIVLSAMSWLPWWRVCMHDRCNAGTRLHSHSWWLIVCTYDCGVILVSCRQFADVITSHYIFIPCLWTIACVRACVRVCMLACVRSYVYFFLGKSSSRFIYTYKSNINESQKADNRMVEFDVAFSPHLINHPPHCAVRLHTCEKRAHSVFAREW